MRNGGERGMGTDMSETFGASGPGSSMGCPRAAPDMRLSRRMPSQRMAGRLTPEEEGRTLLPGCLTRTASSSASARSGRSAVAVASRRWLPELSATAGERKQEDGLEALTPACAGAANGPIGSNARNVRTNERKTVPNDIAVSMRAHALSSGNAPSPRLDEQNILSGIYL